MGLTAFERCAGKWFRDQVNRELTADRLAAGRGVVPCSPHVKFFRHECSRQQGRTRSVALEDKTTLSPEIWVTWSGDDLSVILPEDAHRIVASGEPLEYEVILAGKFSFSWKRGRCTRCGLQVISGEGVLKDARPLTAARQDDLASFSQGMLLRGNAALKREHQ